MDSTSLKEAAVVYKTNKSSNHIPSHWEVFRNVVEENASSEISSFILFAKEVGVSKNIYAELLNINLRTLNRYINLETTLDYDKKEKAIRLNNLFEHGIDVFESKKLFSRWLFEDNTYLSGKPISFLSVMSGIEIVDNLLGKIDYGIIG
jgi:uncharacterized protein (DUF2384 family)